MAVSRLLNGRPPATWEIRRGELTTYFDRTAAEAWEALTSDAPVSKIRATVRAGRERMRALLLARLPRDMAGRTLLDAGCGTGGLAIEAAARGAHVTAIDVAPRLIETAMARAATLRHPGPVPGSTVPREQRAVDIRPGGCRDKPGMTELEVAFTVGDMLDPVLGRFDHVVAMDSLIHYREADIVAALVNLAARTERSILFTIAPKTPLLAAMHFVGKAFPKRDRAPRIEPLAPARLQRAIASEPALAGWRVAYSERVNAGFYMSQAFELVRR